MPPIVYPTDRAALAELGRRRVERFCRLNGLPVPEVLIVPRDEWVVGVCAYYRSGVIRVCLELCQVPAPVANGRNWSWPGSTVDREPYGVICHELGHHADYERGERKGTYGSEYSGMVRTFANEPGLTSYAEGDDWEWFAEAFRLFVTNPDLLRRVRPRTYGILIEDSWKPATDMDWLTALGANCPPRVVAAQRKKMVVPC